MNGRRLTYEELTLTKPGEAITLASVLAILAIAVVAVVCYKMFTSKEGSAKIPSGWAFSWK